VIEEKIVSYLEDNNILGESQGAFRKNRRLEDHVFTLQGICSLQKKKRKNTYLAFLDLDYGVKQGCVLYPTLFYTIILTKPV
jgi:hypothetical protein